jgi:glutamate synthase (ferredoxin)
MFDNCLEFLYQNGRSLPHAIMMMIPEPWSKHESMPPHLRAFYEYHSCLMEPWDGPASIAFSDGVQVGAVLDRNGLRPSRYLVTKDDLVVMASEAGVLDIAPERIAFKGRLQPGKMLLVDTAAGRIIADDELKERLATDRPYGKWLGQQMVTLDDLPDRIQASPVSLEKHGTDPDLVQRQQAFGYTFEDLRVIIAPMAESGREPLGSMGDDTPLAVLSDRPQLLYSYFKQLFAQVTNPPIDAIREELITGTEIRIGSEGNLLAPQEIDCRRIKLHSPILTNAQLAKLRGIERPGFQAATLPLLVPLKNGQVDLQAAMEQLCLAADTAIEQGVNILILSDQEIDRQYTAIPALLATSGLHRHLISQGLRPQVSLIIESGEPREVHHFATLISYGADAVNPYLAYETIAGILHKQLLTGITLEDAVQKYVKAAIKGVVKIISKMGISTIQSYHSAQIHEAVGLHAEVVERYFRGTPSRIGGIGMDDINREVAKRHRKAYPERPSNGSVLEAGGTYHWRGGGESHRLNPKTIHLLQEAVRSGDYTAYKRYAAEMDDHGRQIATLRGLLAFKQSQRPVPLDEVESMDSILRRFKSGAMSYGSISKEAHEAMAVAMNRIGGRSNSGEGGEDPDRYLPDPNGDSRSSAIKQVASGRFGVTSEYLVNAKEIQIKMAQGAKPGEGGQLPGQKVYPWIAKVRYSTPGVGLISPPPHHDIYSIEDLAQLIYDLSNANRKARISVKLVSEVGVGTIAAGVAKGGADVILISGHDGGTGASPQSSIKNAGLPWELGLAETHQTLLLNDLRGRVTLETDGQLRTGRDVAIAALLGAEEFGFATAPLVALGCIMMRVCHLDTCPVGVATQNPELRKNFTGDPQHVVNFMTFVAQELREWMAQLGFWRVEEMVGRTDMLEQRPPVGHWKATNLDLQNLLYQPDLAKGASRFRQTAQDRKLDESLDQRQLLELCRPALDHGRPVRATLPIRNVHRTEGTILGSEVTRRYGAAGLPEDTISLSFTGSAGQSFGAFVPPGLTLTLAGEANDYAGKGLSGGKIIIYPPERATFKAEENIIIGNVAFYGATAGKAFINGMAGERFCVRNSGLEAVVEAVGDHGCEYMTGGRVVILGSTGRNFAAGMSGGVAYVLDETGDFSSRCNQEMVSLLRLDNPEEIDALEALIRQHTVHTGSQKAQYILARWPEMWPRFSKVLPNDYQRMLEAISAAEQKGLHDQEAVMAAFASNKQEVATVKAH